RGALRLRARAVRLLPPRRKPHYARQNPEIKGYRRHPARHPEERHRPAGAGSAQIPPPNMWITAPGRVGSVAYVA
ncbi:hypothetical protein ACWDB3_25930, partial [Streptomyces bacillaris]